MKWVYLIEMFKCWDGVDADPYWGVDVRIYYCKKELTDWDLCEVPGKRRNARFMKCMN